MAPRRTRPATKRTPKRSARKAKAAPQRGGRRNGAGRKPLDAASARVMLTLTAAQVAGLRRAFATVPLATAARAAIAHYLRRAKI